MHRASSVRRSALGMHSRAAIATEDCQKADRRTPVTQQAVELTLGKLLTDEAFRERFLESPEAACWEAGLALSPIELEALSQVPREALSFGV